MSSSSDSRSVTRSPMDRLSRRPTRCVTTAFHTLHMQLPEQGQVMRAALTSDRYRERCALRGLLGVRPTGASTGIEGAGGADGYVALGVIAARRAKLECRADRAGYYNPLIAYGEEEAVQAARDAGANGFIMVDLPPEEALKFRDICTSTG